MGDKALLLPKNSRLKLTACPILPLQGAHYISESLRVEITGETLRLEKALFFYLGDRNLFAVDIPNWLTSMLLFREGSLSKSSIEEVGLYLFFLLSFISTNFMAFYLWYGYLTQIWPFLCEFFLPNAFFFWLFFGLVEVYEFFAESCRRFLVLNSALTLFMAL